MYISKTKVECSSVDIISYRFTEKCVSVELTDFVSKTIRDFYINLHYRLFSHAGSNL